MPFLHIPKILKVDHRIWWAIFGVLHIMMIALMLWAVFTTNWIELKPHALKGSLLYLKEYKDSSKNELYSEFYKKESDCTKLIETSLCDLIYDLSMAGPAYIIFELIAFIFSLVWSAYLWNWIFKCPGLNLCCLHKPYVEVTGMLSFNFIAFITWFATSDVEFTSDCKWDEEKDDYIKTCAGYRPKLALAILVLSGIIWIMFVPIFEIAYGNIIKARDRKQWEPVQEEKIVPISNQRPRGKAWYEV